MGFLLGGLKLNEKLRRTRKGNTVISTFSNVVPRGHFPVYVGEMHTRFVVPICYLNHPLFQELLQLAEQEFGYQPHYPMQ